MKQYIILFFSSILLFTGCSVSELSSLKVEYEETPIGIDIEKPRFSWQMSSSKRSQSQSAYQIIVTDKTGKEVWSSGKTES
ncbi:MAG: hypothetical protein GXZ19_02915, partial [Bacteroidales bacterium]|nr:hypothetical protein [Bacteroidales bacterium]